MRLSILLLLFSFALPLQAATGASGLRPPSVEWGVCRLMLNDLVGTGPQLSVTSAARIRLQAGFASFRKNEVGHGSTAYFAGIGQDLPHDRAGDPWALRWWAESLAGELQGASAADDPKRVLWTSFTGGLGASHSTRFARGHLTFDLGLRYMAVETNRYRPSVEVELPEQGLLLGSAGLEVARQVIADRQLVLRGDVQAGAEFRRIQLSLAISRLPHPDA